MTARPDPKPRDVSLDPVRLLLLNGGDWETAKMVLLQEDLLEHSDTSSVPEWLARHSRLRRANRHSLARMAGELHQGRNGMTPALLAWGRRQFDASDQALSVMLDSWLVELAYEAMDIGAEELSAPTPSGFYSDDAPQFTGAELAQFAREADELFGVLDGPDGETE